jgi:hypothetical protein
LEEEKHKLLQANFLTEFGLHCGLPEQKDPTSEETMTGFLARVGEWGGRDAASVELVRCLMRERRPSGSGDSVLARLSGRLGSLASRAHELRSRLATSYSTAEAATTPMSAWERAQERAQALRARWRGGTHHAQAY